MVAECMQVVPINFEKSRLSLEELARARGGGGVAEGGDGTDGGCAGRAAPLLG